HRSLSALVPCADRAGLRIFIDGLDTLVEHHLFPDLPPSMQRQIAPDVRAIAARYGLPYNETPLLETGPLIAKTLAGLSAPLGAREFGRPRELFTQPRALLLRLASGMAYKPLPEQPYLAYPR